jgi:hypothetical protein
MFVFIYGLIAHGVSANPLAKWLGRKEAAKLKKE